MIKTVNLTANQEFAVELHGGCHCYVENRGDSVIYASKSANIVPDADGVIAIDSGNSKILRNVAQYQKNDDTYDYYGKIYLLSDADGKAEIQTADDLNFFSGRNSGGGGKSLVSDISSCIVCSPEQPTDLKKGLWIKTDKTNADIVFSNSIETVNTSNSYSCNSFPNGILNASSVAVGDKCYIFGGYTGNSSYSNEIKIYDCKNNVISKSTCTLARLSSCGNAGISIKSKCYIFGGYAGNSSYSNEIQVMDTETNTITVVGTFPDFVRKATVTAVGDKCYIFTPIQGTSSVKTIYIYDTKTNICTKSRTEAPFGLSYSPCVSKEDKCYIANYNNIYIYDTKTESFTTGCRLAKQAYSFYSNILLDDKFYLLGGQYSDSKGSSLVQVYDIKTNTMSISDYNLFTERRSHSVSMVNRVFYVFGGIDENENIIASIEKLNLSLPKSFVRLKNNDLYTYLDNIAIKVALPKDVTKSTNQIAVSHIKNVYDYKPILNIYYSEHKYTENIVTELDFYKIENYEIV